jgi:hypothetical protein
MITRTYCMKYIGQPVGVRLRDGRVHRGILHSVTDHGIHLRPLPVRTVDGDNTIKVDVLQNLPQTDLDGKEVFFPFLFFPFLALSLLWPLAFWW